MLPQMALIKHRATRQNIPVTKRLYKSTTKWYGRKASATKNQDSAGRLCFLTKIFYIYIINLTPLLLWKRSLLYGEVSFSFRSFN